MGWVRLRVFFLCPSPLRFAFVMTYTSRPPFNLQRLSVVDESVAVLRGQIKHFKTYDKTQRRDDTFFLPCVM